MAYSGNSMANNFDENFRFPESWEEIEEEIDSDDYYEDKHNM
jgi:hypothetical protein